MVSSYVNLGYGTGVDQGRAETHWRTSCIKLRAFSARFPGGDQPKRETAPNVWREEISIASFS